MATGIITFAELDTPVAPGGRIHFAKVGVPGIMAGRIHYAKLSTPAGSVASGAIHFASVVTPASPDAVPASGLYQMASNGAWWNVAVRQRTSNEEWV